jgi:hypothetical protein
VDFEFGGELIPASLERYKQDYSETQCYLLTKIDVEIPNGTILMIQSKNNITTPWMVWWLEKIESSGYNKYVVLKMTHFLKWKTQDGSSIEQWAYFSGPGATAISDAIRSASGEAVYKENNNLHTFITTQNETICRDLYFEVTQGNITQGYVVKEFDINSTPGVNYVSVDPVPVRNEQTAPIPSTGDKKEDFFWIQGGVQ